MKYKHYILKRKIEDIFIYPFILIGRLFAFAKPLKKEYETFFFFPFYHTGGAEKVHALVTQATGNNNCIIYFTRKSQDKNFFNDFAKSGCTINDISKYTDNKFVYFVNFISRGIITAHINSQKKQPIVFNGQCNFGYKISPWIKKQIPQIELIHSFNTFSWIRIPFLPFISRTVMISQLRIDDHLRQYETIGIPSIYKARIQHIVNGISLPVEVKQKELTGNIRVLYVGRGTEEKRVQLIGKIAEQSSLIKLPTEFLFMGEVKDAIPRELLQYCKLLGHQSDQNEIDNIYQDSHIVIITSYTEGFPMVIEEGMARGCAVIATPVGDIPVHVKNNINGLLFSSVKDEALVVKEAVDFLTLLNSNRMMLKEMRDKNIHYAINNFSIHAFNKNYRELFNNLRSEES